MTTERALGVSDIQFPYHDRKAVDLCFSQLTEGMNVYCVGDEIDFPQVSRWSKGWAAEYEGTLQKHIDGNFDLWRQVRMTVGWDAEIHISRSNHVDRLERYVERYAPGLGWLRALRTEAILGYDELGIVFHREPFEFAPDWLLMHGDEGSLSRISGRTAGLLAEQYDMNVMCGHTHRIGRSSKTRGHGRRRRTVQGVEIGNLMDVRKAEYVQNPDWQQGFAIIHRDDRLTEVQTVYIQRGRVVGL